MENNKLSGTNSEKLMKLVTLCSVAVAISIIFVKILAWTLTDSLSLLSSLVDSVMDVFASLITFMAVRYSLMPADDDHRFGHGKAEDIAAFSQSVFIAGSGLFILVEVVGRIINPHEIGNEIVGIATMLFSTILTLGLITFQSYVIRKTNSSAIKADSLHYKADILVNIVVIISFISSIYFDYSIIDTILALGIALYVLKSAYNIGAEAFDKLMDKEFSEDKRKKIINAILNNKDVMGVHDLRTRSSGIKPFIQFHLELDGDIKLNKAHDISDEIEMQILKIMPNAEILIHQDVAGGEMLSSNIGRYTKDDN